MTINDAVLSIVFALGIWQFACTYYLMKHIGRLEDKIEELKTAAWR